MVHYIELTINDFCLAGLILELCTKKPFERLCKSISDVLQSRSQNLIHVPPTDKNTGMAKSYIRQDYL